MAFTLLGLLIAVVLFLGMLGFLELGYRRIASVIYVVIDLEFPRVGMIRISGSDRFLIEVRESMK